MDSVSGTQPRRSRQACEPCRNPNAPESDPFVHFASDSTCSRSQKQSTKDRVRTLESQVAALSELLSRSNGVHDVQASVQTQPTACSITQDGDSSLAIDTVSGERATTTFSESQPDPPQDVLNHFVQVYGTTVHLQPLPLFELDSLSTKLQNAPQYFVHSFLALMLEFSTHEFYHNSHSEAARFYSRSAAATTQRVAAEGNPRAEVIQALSMLALKDIAVSELSRAWMSVGTATRLESIRKLRQHDLTDVEDQDVENRCYWSIYMIETIFFPHMPRAPESDPARKHPSSLEPPPPIPLDTNEANTLDFDNAIGATNDLGINTHAGRMIAVWSQVACHLHEIRVGKVQIPWLPDSTYSKLNLSLFEYEAQFHQRHLMRSLFPFKRQPDEMLAYRQYWHPWLTTHVILHASLALLNHPFIHLVALRRNKGIRQSRLFLQQVVDQALFHCGWVFWLIGIFEDLSVEVSNPLIGNVDVARKARQNLAKGKRFLERLSQTWPCVSHKLESLNRLQSLVIGTQTEVGATDTTISFPPSMIWELLDPVIHDAALFTSSQTSPSESQPNVSIHVTTDFLHPLADDNVAEPTFSQVNWEDSLMYGNEFLPDMYPASLVPFDFNDL
ncbi:hypothetical protein FSARC_1188 [Fusarium sarcochroum]|uniref:Transcription factor domain-containing protein n=1 Tax=Fusarium sarcochroum TaxID=1208366 RepID=A0A8H4U9J3_9HYPO|nr:hypothetical protein FSARC_1188 [Fusarium sarcochroum]